MDLNGWHWLILAIAIFMIEAMGIGGFFLGAGVAAVVVALSAWLIDGFHWQWQLAVFAVLAVVFTLVYWQRFRRFNLGTQADTINQGAAVHIGKEFRALFDSVDGRTKVSIGDALWTVQVEARAGDRIKISGAESLLLLGERVAPAQNIS